MSDRHQSTFVCNISQFVVHSLVCEQTSINNAKPRNADIRQHLLATQATNPGPRAPPSTISATPATQNDGRCEIVPRLPRDIKVHVTKCHACHAKWRGRPRRHRRQIPATPATQSGAAPRASQATNPGPRAPPSTISATPATQNDGRCEIVPRLPRDIKVHVTKCHACHAKWRGAPGITGDKSRPKGATQYHKCHACHAKRQ